MKLVFDDGTTVDLSRTPTQNDPTNTTIVQAQNLPLSVVINLTVDLDRTINCYGVDEAIRLTKVLRGDAIPNTKAKKKVAKVK